MILSPHSGILQKRAPPGRFSFSRGISSRSPGGGRESSAVVRSLCFGAGQTGIQNSPLPLVSYVGLSYEVA